MHVNEVLRHRLVHGVSEEPLQDTPVQSAPTSQQQGSQAVRQARAVALSPGYPIITSNSATFALIWHLKDSIQRPLSSLLQTNQFIPQAALCSGEGRAPPRTTLLRGSIFFLLPSSYHLIYHFYTSLYRPPRASRLPSNAPRLFPALPRASSPSSDASVRSLPLMGSFKCWDNFGSIVKILT